MTRRLVGQAGERIAAAVLAEHGVEVVGHNVLVGRGELDLVGVENGRRIVVEVRTVSGPANPLHAFDHGKRSRVSRFARQIGARRVDLMAVRLDTDAAEVRWVKGAA